MGTVSSLLAEHVSFRCTSIDRIFVAGYVPGLQSEGMVIRFLLSRGYKIPSPAGLAHNHDRFQRDIDAFIETNAVPVVRFVKGQSKEEASRPYLLEAAAAGKPAVAVVGVAQERVAGWRGWRDGGRNEHPHFSYGRQSLFVNHHYFYVWDPNWGPMFFKLCGYAPYPLWVWANGHEWAKRQLAQAEVGFEALDNGLRSCEDPALAHRVCARLGAGHLRAVIRQWLDVLPSALTPADHANGFRHAFSVRQLEISDTAVFDRPAAGRAWFTAAIRDHLDLGRPDKVRLIVDRRICLRGPAATPGRFETRVVTKGVDPVVQIHYRSSKVKAYFKEGRALRVETTINDPTDFGVKKTLCTENWRALKQTGVEVNARFLAACGEGAGPLPDATALTQVVLPSDTDDGLRAPGLRFGDPRVTAILAALAAFAHTFNGLTNATLVERVGPLLDRPYTSRQATYDLRRLRRKGFIERCPGRHAYQVTPRGRRYACLLTKINARVVVPALTDIQQAARPPRSPRPLAAAWAAYEHQIDLLLATASLPS